MIRDFPQFFSLLMAIEKQDLMDRLRVITEEEILILAKNEMKFSSLSLPHIQGRSNHCRKDIDLDSIIIKQSMEDIADPLSKRVNILPPLLSIDTRIADYSVSQSLSIGGGGGRRREKKEGSRLYIKIKQAKEFNFENIFGKNSYGFYSSGNVLLTKNRRKRKRSKKAKALTSSDDDDDDWNNTLLSSSYSYESFAHCINNNINNFSSSEDWTDVLMSSIDRWTSSSSIAEF